MKNEIWKKIIINNQETFYSVSNYGNVKNDSTKTLLGGSISNNGYKMVHLRYRIDKNCSIHRLVMKAFKPCENMDDLQINHIDGDKLNNNLINLEWSSALENMRHSYINNLQSKKMKPCYQYDLEGNFIKEYINGLEASNILNIDYANILRCLNEEQFHYLTFQFKTYKKNKIEPWSNPKNIDVYLYDDNGNFIKHYPSQKDCANDLGLSISSISRFINNKRKLKNFIFSKIPL
jgi:hypothetical protein